MYIWTMYYLRGFYIFLYIYSSSYWYKQTFFFLVGGRKYVWKLNMMWNVVRVNNLKFVEKGIQVQFAWWLFHVVWIFVFLKPKNSLHLNVGILFKCFVLVVSTAFFYYCYFFFFVLSSSNLVFSLNKNKMTRLLF